LSTQEALVQLSKKEPFSLITSDIAPSIDGNRIREQAFFLELTQNIINFSMSYAKKKYWVIQKVFQGEEFDEILSLYRKFALKVEIFKPISSRLESREVFVIAQFMKD
jgi:23S rRNA (uridine2552-2'-O)-methyltransferase